AAQFPVSAAFNLSIGPEGWPLDGQTRDVSLKLVRTSCNKRPGRATYWITKKILEHEFLAGFVGHHFSAACGDRKRLWFFSDCITFNPLRLGTRHHRGPGNFEQISLID